MIDFAQAFRDAFGIEPTADAFMRLRKMLKDRTELHLVLEMLHHAVHHAVSPDVVVAAVCMATEIAQTQHVTGTAEVEALQREAEHRRSMLDEKVRAMIAKAQGGHVSDPIVGTNFFGADSPASRTKH